MRLPCPCAQKLEFIRRLQRKKAVTCGFQVDYRLKRWKALTLYIDARDLPINNN